MTVTKSQTISRIVFLLSTTLFLVSSFGLNSISTSFTKKIRLSSSAIQTTLVSSSRLQMMGEECPEIPVTAQLDPKYDTCIIALGWFWHPQLEFQQMEGVERVVVGYTGGKELYPTYQNIKDSTEAVLIEYDPSIISYEQLLFEWSKQHFPYSPPMKTQYKSAIWVKNDDERKIVMEFLEKLKEARSVKKLYVDVEDVNPFYRAEEYHQDFLNKQRSSRSFTLY